MLITLLQRFQDRNNKRKRSRNNRNNLNTEHYDNSETEEDAMSSNTHGMMNRGLEDNEWHVVVPITEDEDFEVVLPSDLPHNNVTRTAADRAIPATTASTLNSQRHPPPIATNNTSTVYTDPASGTRSFPLRRGIQRNNNNNGYNTPQAPTVVASIPPASTTSFNNSDVRNNIPIYDRMKEWKKQRQSQREQLGQSISNTFAEIAQEQPNQMEQDQIQRAMELSMLDFALVYYQPSRQHRQQQQSPQQQRKPHHVLGVSETANHKEIKVAYRQLAKLHHPDKGGDANRFEEIARAYRSMLSSSVGGSFSTLDRSSDHYHSCHDSSPTINIKSTAHWDQELQDHRRLVNDLFQADGMDLEACVTKQLAALDMLGLRFKDAGASNRNEKNEIIRNSCFYLSLATSYLWGIGALSFDNDVDNITNGTNHMDIDDEDVAMTDDTNDEEDLLVGETALQLKRTIEAAVVKAHPEWCLQGKVGEEVQAFSDFLVYTLDSPTLLSDWAVIVFDSTSGFCDIYKGQQYDKHVATDPAWAQSNTITLRYLPGHYQPLVPVSASARRPTLQDTLTALDDHGVFYVVTDGNS